MAKEKEPYVYQEWPKWSVKLNRAVASQEEWDENDCDEAPEEKKPAAPKAQTVDSKELTGGKSNTEDETKKKPKRVRKPRKGK